MFHWFEIELLCIMALLICILTQTIAQEFSDLEISIRASIIYQEKWVMGEQGKGRVEGASEVTTSCLLTYSAP